ncbi:MAG TPA: ABC transporter permease [Terriglobales bacterium]|nr:ABC transporter permease [Terriglobales bacterium]
MTLSPTLDKLLAVLRRDLLIAIRYRSGFLLAAAGSCAELAAFYYLSRSVGPGFRPEGVEYFPFLLVGTGLYTFLLMGINAFLNTIEDGQRNGTLEVLMTTPTPPALLVVLSAISAFAASGVNFVLYLAAGLLLFGARLQVNVFGCLAILGLSLFLAVSFGLFAAALQLAIQKGSAVIWLLSSGMWFLTGTMFPVSSLPRGLHYLSTAIPITHALNGMRLALLENAPLPLLGREIAILALFVLILLPASLSVFARTLRRARLQGTLSFY